MKADETGYGDRTFGRGRADSHFDEARNDGIVDAVSELMTAVRRFVSG